mmetsp:Transcript_9572/g.19832  ORF Transcript_9572/g.19832 Transcript_9572/m.19832 type:complete len:211 (+) Transcript_9572:406-1038(+)
MEMDVFKSHNETRVVRLEVFLVILAPIIRKRIEMNGRVVFQHQWDPLNRSVFLQIGLRDIRAICITMRPSGFVFVFAHALHPGVWISHKNDGQDVSHVGLSLVCGDIRVLFGGKPVFPPRDLPTGSPGLVLSIIGHFTVFAHIHGHWICSCVEHPGNSQRAIDRIGLLPKFLAAFQPQDDWTAPVQMFNGRPLGQNGNDLWIDFVDASLV